MKRRYIIILLFVTILLGLCQNCLTNKDRVYYDKYFNVYISLKQGTTRQRIACDVIRIGKSLSSMDSKILFTHVGETSSFEIIPKNDTVYIYDSGNWIEGTSNGSLILKKVNWCPRDSDKVMIDNKWEYINYHYEDSAALKSTPKRIAFTCGWQVKPYLWNGSYFEDIERIE